MRNLALDPSYRATGWAVFDDMKLEDYGVITTSRDATARYVMEDNIRRDTIIWRDLNQLMRFIDGDVIAEMPSGGAQSAHAAGGMARVSGVVVASCLSAGLNLIPLTASVCQKKTYGKCLKSEKKSASIRYVTNLYPQLAGLPKYKAEHICDAIAAYLAADSMDLVRKEK